MGKAEEKGSLLVGLGLPYSPVNSQRAGPAT